MWKHGEMDQWLVLWSIMVFFFYYMGCIWQGVQILAPFVVVPPTTDGVVFWGFYLNARGRRSIPQHKLFEKFIVVCFMHG